MQYKCEAMGRQCLVDVEMGREKIEVKIYGDGPTITILHAYNIALDTSWAIPNIEQISERAARAAIADFEGLSKPGLGSYPKMFSGALIPVP